mgnify:CR=1 FL=1
MIKKISAAQAYPLRQAILRPDGIIADCQFDGDELASTMHFGLFDGDALVAIASVYYRDYENNEYYVGKGYQLRSMAVAKAVQGQGIGQQLLTAICDEMKAMDVDYLWANARVSAITFYQQADFDISPAVFDIADVGPHQHIVKRFN